MSFKGILMMSRTTFGEYMYNAFNFYTEEWLSGKKGRNLSQELANSLR